MEEREEKETVTAGIGVERDDGMVDWLSGSYQSSMTLKGTAVERTALEGTPTGGPPHRFRSNWILIYRLSLKNGPSEPWQAALASGLISSSLQN